MIDELQLLRSFRAEDAAADPTVTAAAYERLCAHIAATGHEEDVRIGDGVLDTAIAADPMPAPSERPRRSSFLTRWWFWLAAVVSTALGLLLRGRSAEAPPPNGRRRSRAASHRRSRSVEFVAAGMLQRNHALPDAADGDDLAVGIGDAACSDSSDGRHANFGSGMNAPSSALIPARLATGDSGPDAELVASATARHDEQFAGGMPNPRSELTVTRRRSWWRRGPRNVRLSTLIIASFATALATAAVAQTLQLGTPESTRYTALAVGDGTWVTASGDRRVTLARPDTVGALAGEDHLAASRSDDAPEVLLTRSRAGENLKIGVRQLAAGRLRLTNTCTRTAPSPCHGRLTLLNARGQTARTPAFTLDSGEVVSVDVRLRASAGARLWVIWNAPGSGGETTQRAQPVTVAPAVTN